MSRKTVSIIIDTELDKQARELQGEIMLETRNAWSYSATIHLLIEEGLKHQDLIKNLRLPNID